MKPAQGAEHDRRRLDAVRPDQCEELGAAPVDLHQPATIRGEVRIGGVTRAGERQKLRFLPQRRCRSLKDARGSTSTRIRANRNSEEAQRKESGSTHHGYIGTAAPNVEMSRGEST